MTKGIDWNNKIEYAVKPKPIKVRELGTNFCCENCASNGKFMFYEISYNETNFETPKGNIGKKRYAKPRAIWLCEDCFNEMKEAFNNIQKQEREE